MFPSAVKAAFFFVLLAFVPGLVHADAVSYERLIEHLGSKYPPRHRILSPVDEVHSGRLAFAASDESVSRGHELLVLKQDTDVPDYLLPSAGVIRVESQFEDKVLAQTLTSLGGAIEEGDLVAQPASPVLYVYTNIREKESSAQYTHLIDTLLENNYEVVEVYGRDIQRYADRYGLLLRLEGIAGDNLAVKVQSLYSGDTFFARTQEISTDIQTTAAAGVPLHLAQASAIQETASKTPASNQSSGMDTKVPSAETEKPKKQAAGFEQAQPLYHREVLRLERKYSRFVPCEADGNPGPEFALLRDNGLDIYDYQEGRLQQLADSSFDLENSVGLHLHALDITGDGQDELVVTMGKVKDTPYGEDTFISSRILACQDGRVRTYARDLPYYLRVIEDRNGEQVLIGQKKGESEPYAGDICRFTWDAESQELVNRGLYEPAANIYALYQFAFQPQASDHVLILEPSNDVAVYFVPTEELNDISDKNYGQFHLTSYPVLRDKAKFTQAMEENSRLVFAPRRLVLKNAFDGQAFVINKQRQTRAGLNRIKDLMGDRNAQDSLVGLKWNGQNIQETWESKKISKDIYDFGFCTFQGEDRVFVLVRDKQGFSLQTL
jgi:hypothetical protein